MAHVAEIWRHPIKSHGHERIDATSLSEGRAMPWDRRWAVAHDQSKFDPAHPSWTPCGEFSIGNKSPALQAIHCKTDDKTGLLTLSHPRVGAITFNPDTPADAAAFIQWVAPLVEPERAKPAQLVAAPDAMTDTDYQSISLINLASHHAVEGVLGHALDPLRWRGNLLIDDLAPWSENDWVGKHLRIGSAVLHVKEKTRRCNATMANPKTGEKDVNTLAALRDGFGHQDCGVYATVVQSGDLRAGDKIEIL